MGVQSLAGTDYLPHFAMQFARQGHCILQIAASWHRFLFFEVGSHRAPCPWAPSGFMRACLSWDGATAPGCDEGCMVMTQSLSLRRYARTTVRPIWCTKQNRTSGNRL